MTSNKRIQINIKLNKQKKRHRCCLCSAYPFLLLRNGGPEPPPQSRAKGPSAAFSLHTPARPSHPVRAQSPLSLPLLPKAPPQGSQLNTLPFGWGSPAIVRHPQGSGLP